MAESLPRVNGERFIREFQFALLGGSRTGTAQWRRWVVLCDAALNATVKTDPVRRLHTLAPTYL